MVQINFAQKQVNAKVVYYGPGMSGKTTNLEIVHQRAPSNNRGDLTSISTDGDRTLFFDFMPLDLGTVAGMRTCFQIYTVPGQVYYNSTRKLVLQGVDGVVFVADSSAAMLEENLESLRNLEQNLNEYGKSLATVPHVIQFNKRDLPDAMSLDELNRLLNLHNAPSYEAIANSGQGVFPTLKGLAARVLESIHNGSRPSAAGAAPASAPQGVAAQPKPSPVAPVSAAKTGFYGTPTTSPAAMAAAQRALQQTGFHAAVQAPQPSHVQRPAPMPPPLSVAAQSQPAQGHPMLQSQPIPQGMQPMHGMHLPAGGSDLGRGGSHASPSSGPLPSHPQMVHSSPMMAPIAQPTMSHPGMSQPGMQAGPQAGPGSLRMAGPQAQADPRAGGLATMPRQGAQSAQGGTQMMRPETGKPPAPGPRTPAKPAPRPAPATSKRSNPAPAPVQPMPVKKSKGMVYAAIFVVVALGIGAVVAKVVLKAF